MNGSIEMETENGEKVIFYIVEETTVNSVSYILVTDSPEEEGNAYILKDVSDSLQEEALYQIVEDETELSRIGTLFQKMLEDVDLQV